MPEHPAKRRILNWMQRAAFANTRFVPWTMRNGQTIALAKWDLNAQCGVGWTCFEYGEWESHVERGISNLLKPGDNAIDIGANLGYFTAVMAERVGPTGQVHSFEPVPVTFAQLEATCRFSGCDNVRLHNVALGAEVGAIRLNYDLSVLGNASVMARAEQQQGSSVTVPMKTLDSLFAAGELPAAALIKIDVEGHELDVFRGGRQYLSSVQPTIIFEFNAETSAAGGWTLEAVGALLRSAGDYHFSLLINGGHRLPIDLSKVTLPAGAYVDIVASASPSVA